MGTGVKPTGTVTFMFTDIVGSTQLWDREPEAMDVALERHNVLLRGEVDAHDGYIFNGGGDGYVVAFSRTADAVRAAVAIQRHVGLGEWPDRARITVRIGLHVGAATERAGDYFGPPVNVAARVMALARGGQVVVSQPVARLCGRIDGLTFVEAGRYRLRGVADHIDLEIVEGDGLVTGSLAVATDANAVVPRVPTGFVGRSADIDRVINALADHQLVTLAGTAGVGKTRLAIEVATRTSANFTDGVFFVDLAPLTEGDGVAHALLAGLGVQPLASRSLVDSVVDALMEREALVVIDNCEHVLNAVRELVPSILARCSNVRVLATSRSSLGVWGEVVRAVAPLSRADAVALFLERAGTLDEDFQGDAQVIDALCDRLDDIPLAIELAAARTGLMQPAELLERLTDRFRLLRGRTTIAERHRTMKAAVDWSYQLLSPEEQLLFARLSVFVGTFDLAAADDVAGHGVLADADVSELLDSLVARSMVSVTRVEGRTRLRLLETLREYGATELAALGETAELLARHSEYYLVRAEHADAALRGAGFTEGRRWFTREIDNVRSAVRFERFEDCSLDFGLKLF